MGEMKNWGDGKILESVELDQLQMIWKNVNQFTVLSSPYTTGRQTKKEGIPQKLAQTN